MKKITVCFAVLLVLAMAGGTAMAWNATDHVKFAPNGKGDLLFFPWFWAMPNGYQTKITVINTSATHSAIAKVSYRAYGWSVEVLDHFIYLSPNDVWVGTLFNDNGLASFKCSDDSMLGRAVLSGGTASADDFADKTPILSKQLADTAITWGCNSDSNQIGYVEVLEVASIPITDVKVPYSGGKVAKYNIYNYYHSTAFPFALIQDYSATGYAPRNILTGYQENFINQTQTLKRAVVFADYDNAEYQTIALNTPLGQQSRNTLAEVEAAMAKSNVALPYVARANGDETIHIFNFPTKYSAYNSYACNAQNYHFYYNSPYWTAVYNMCETYTRNTYDLMENSPASGNIFSPIPVGSSTMCEEVHFNFLEYTAASSAYTEGWVRYNWGQTNTYKNGKIKQTETNLLWYSGTPVLPSVLYWTDSGMNWAEADAAYDNGIVWVGSALQEYYQYSD